MKGKIKGRIAGRKKGKMERRMAGRKKGKMTKVGWKDCKISKEGRN